jgi:hypothetical protein
MLAAQSRKAHAPSERETLMTLHPKAGQPATRDMLVDVAQLEHEYYARRPDLDDPRQLVSFGTSGHRGTSLNGSFTEAHILAITQSICDYRRANGINGPLLMGKDTMPCRSRRNEPPSRCCPPTVWRR